jgi:hypothetical protein
LSFTKPSLSPAPITGDQTISHSALVDGKTVKERNTVYFADLTASEKGILKRGYTEIMSTPGNGSAQRRLTTDLE